MCCWKREEYLNRPVLPFRLSADEIIAFMADEANVTIPDLLSKQRTDRLSHARFRASWLMRHLAGMSYPVIGRRLHRDHSSIIHGVRLLEERAEKWPLFGLEMQKLKQRARQWKADGGSVPLVPSEQYKAEHKPDHDPLH